MGDDARVQTTADQRIRAELRQSPGAHPCPAPGCLVITQGGIAGLRIHQQVVHGSNYQEQR